jgi:hypothetical protein
LTPDTGRTLQDGVVLFSTDFRNSGNYIGKALARDPYWGCELSMMTPTSEFEKPFGWATYWIPEA